MTLTEFMETNINMQMKTNASTHQSNYSAREIEILRAALKVFGHYGYKKTSVEQLAKAADLSKPSLYLHFSGKENIFEESMKFYLLEGLRLIEDSLKDTDLPINERIINALDHWFGRNIDLFHIDPHEVITVGNRIASSEVEEVKTRVVEIIAAAISQNCIANQIQLKTSALELAKVMFLFGTCWKENNQTRYEFRKNLELFVRALL